MFGRDTSFDDVTTTTTTTTIPTTTTTTPFNPSRSTLTSGLFTPGGWHFLRRVDGWLIFIGSTINVGSFYAGQAVDIYFFDFWGWGGDGVVVYLYCYQPGLLIRRPKFNAGSFYTGSNYRYKILNIWNFLIFLVFDDVIVVAILIFIVDFSRDSHMRRRKYLTFLMT